MAPRRVVTTRSPRPPKKTESRQQTNHQASALVGDLDTSHHSVLGDLMMTGLAAEDGGDALERIGSDVSAAQQLLRTAHDRVYELIGGRADRGLPVGAGLINLAVCQATPRLLRRCCSRK